jgi:hypothetical protein
MLVSNETSAEVAFEELLLDLHFMEHNTDN